MTNLSKTFPFLFVGMMVMNMGIIAMDTSSFTEGTGAHDDLSSDDWSAMEGLLQEARYYITRHDPSEGFVGTNSKCGIGMIFNESGVSVSPYAENSWSCNIALSGSGYCDQVSPITVSPQLSVDKNRVEYEYSPQLTEWYINDEKGLEQGYTIESPPQPRADAPLTIEMALKTSLKPKMIDNREAIAFFDNSGEHILTYRNLIVIDASGQDVSAWLSLSDTSLISIYIDDSSAAYPLTIDPLITTEVKKLTASDGVADDRFSFSLSISGDTIVVGAYYNDVGANMDQGSAYVFERNQGGADNWGQVTKLTASDGAAEDCFGRSVSMSGDTIVVGAWFDDIGANVDQGSAYVFKRNQGGADNWGEVIKLTASDGDVNDHFGRSVSNYYNTIIVGAYSDNVGANGDQGSAYVFKRNQGGADNWGQVTKLTASDGAAVDNFGFFVSIFGDTIVIGAYLDDVGANMDQGSAYVFERNQGGADVWGQVTKLTASDGAAEDWFGRSMSIFGDTIVVGADTDDVGANIDQGSAYVFERNQGGADVWGQVTKLIASDGAAVDRFGITESISSDTIVVGAHGVNSEQGSAYVFERNQGGPDNWGQIIRLTSSDGAPRDFFGRSVSISGETIVVGAWQDDVGANIDQGSAYVFVRTGNTWVEQSHPIASDGVADDVFGCGVSIFGDTIVVGAGGADIGGNNSQGAAYVFERNTGGFDVWGEVTKLTALDGAAGDNFGNWVSIYCDTIVVTAFWDDVGGNGNQGSAYVFERNQGGPDNWGQVSKLTASDGAAGDNFGCAGYIFGDTIIVGAYQDNSDRGSAYVFERNQGGQDNWGQVSKLTASDGAAGDNFGLRVSIFSDTIVVGAYRDDVGAADRGSAYVFERNQGGVDNWGQVTKLTASDGAAGDNFGMSVSIFGDTIAVGAWRDDVGANSNQGSAYVFERNTGGSDVWGEVAKLTALDGAAGDNFGCFSISIFDDTIVVGAYWDDVGTNNNQGSAYVFERNQGGADTWGQVTKLTASDGAAGDIFGRMVSVFGDTIVVPAMQDDVGANANQGSVYVFKLTVDFVILLDEGWNLISLPLTQTDTSIDKVLSSIDGKWDYIQVYNATDPDHWKTNATFRPDQLNDLESLNHKMGFWINITEPNVNLTVYGGLSTSRSIPLYAGWNLVGYPTLNVSTPIWSSLWGTGTDAVMVCDPAEPYRIKEIAPSYMMKPGEGYWVHVPADTVWVVDW